MQIYTSYKVKIKHYNHIFKDTVKIYRHAVDYLIPICITHWEQLTQLKSQLKDSFDELKFIENLIHATKKNPFGGR